MPEPPSHDAAHAYATGLAERLHSSARLQAHAQALQQRSAGAPAWQARAELLRAWADTYESRMEAAQARAASALKVLLDQGDDAGAADARDLLSRHATGAGQLERARDLLALNHALPAGARTPLAWGISSQRQAALLEWSGVFDEALRWHYRSIALARESGWPSEEAMALACAGGLQLSLQNAEDGAALLDAAWRLAHPALETWGRLWPVVAVNRLMALHLRGRADEALFAMPAVLAALPQLAPSNRYKALLLMGGVHVAAGQVARGQALLDEGLALCPTRQGARPVEWVWAQADAWTRQGRAADALAICGAHFDAAAGGRLPQADLPADLVQLHRIRAAAHEALGDLAGALQAERDARAAERQLASAAQRAQRLTLQIHYEREEAERARAEAEREAHHALAERARLAELNAALEAADRAKSRFLAAASHDLRQPVHALTLQLALLRTMLQAGAQQTQAARIQASLDALKAMFDALLDISRIDAGVVQPQWQTVALRPLCARLVEEFSPAAQARGLRVALRLTGPASTRSDPALLETLLRNLLDNAVKYTLRGGVLLALRSTSAGGWRLQVRDTGPGIAHADQARVFEEFVQLAAQAAGAHPRPPAPGAEASAAGPGLGLGLSIVRRLARLLGHPLTLHSREGRGCLFELQLPALPHEPAAPRPQATGASPVVAARPLRIALVEDHEPTRVALARLLEQWGHEVAAAGDAAGLPGRLASRESNPGHGWDCVITDLRLAGGVDGLAEAGRLVGGPGDDPGGRPESRSRGRLLVVTAETDAAPLRRLAEGGVPWMTKPLDPARLAAWLAREFPPPRGETQGA